VDHQPDTPFESIEGAQEFVELLAEAIEEARKDIEAEIAAQQPERRMQALQLGSYNLAKLSLHIGTSRRILNDLRTLRRLLLQERQLEREAVE
jgi:hypothetical protein